MQRGPRSEALRGVPNPSAPAKKIDSSSNRTGCLRYQRTLSGFEPPAARALWNPQQKSRPVILDKAALGCYIGVSKSGARARCWSLPSIDLRSKGKPLPLRWRLFLYVPEDTKDNRCHEQ